MILVVFGILLSINPDPILGLGYVINNLTVPSPLSPTIPVAYPASNSSEWLSIPYPANNPSPDNSALMIDAQMYAENQNTSVEEAQRRLQIQDSIGELNARLSANERATFCGLWIQHQPDFRVVTCFTHDGNNTIRPYIENSQLADIIEIRSASVSLSSLEKAQSEMMQICNELEIPCNSSVDLKNNTVDLYVLDPVVLYDALQAADLRLPDNIQVIQVDELAG